ESGEAHVEESDLSSFGDGGFRFSSISKPDAKKLLHYLDEMLGTLPEEFVEQFAQSEYFDLYKKLMEELEQ
ncbi:MAG TPA: hypothetical protein PK453_25840, partial [Leptospiraceae bacterium]|nr:hypothetical protein [Leptospiraceae bacterium]